MNISGKIIDFFNHISPMYLSCCGKSPGNVGFVLTSFTQLNVLSGPKTSSIGAIYDRSKAKVLNMVIQIGAKQTAH